jgi:endonuclease YncB( thermonuclease family)
MKVPGATRVILAAGLAAALAAVTFGVGAPEAGPAFSCTNARVSDGDTVRCGKQRIRLYGIDAPELPGHCNKGRRCTPGDPYASTRNLAALLNKGAIECREIERDRYGRIVADCSAGQVDLACAQLKGGFAVRRYSNIAC